ncbi:hypothetical protein [uncultured Mediterranean phage uvMED]|nr:hypothetical protein [uncultured Mediterranean phage uvMED]BAQ84851.1 hypothetical protein [uncultured Mediterranean phage uvMED]BAR13785.1 hypothetical protein [uncultured Mediterranean phage uvMED]BAR14856.1 hypothetical protein [uncultured Mediterranean phage uvMED]
MSNSNTQTWDFLNSCIDPISDNQVSLEEWIKSL